jgi:hypothetical protein
VRRQALWPHLRALLILAHLISVILLSLPSSRRLHDRSYWDLPKQQRELEAWADRLDVGKEEFESFLWRNTQRYVKARRWFSRPFLKYADYSGTRQGWTMFASPRLTTARFEVEVEIAGQWQLVFRPHDDEADWNRWQFDHNRVRKLLGRLAVRPHQSAYKEFTKWVARSLARDFPSATRAKVTLITWQTLPPEQVRDGVAPIEHRTRYQEFSLEDLR